MSGLVGRVSSWLGRAGPAGEEEPQQEAEPSSDKSGPSSSDDLSMETLNYEVRCSRGGR